MKVLAHITAASAAVALALAPAPAAAQMSGASAPTADIMPYAGWLITGNFLEGPLGTSVSTAGGPMYGVQASLPLAPGISVFGNVASSKADLKVGIPFLGGVEVGEVETLLYDGGLRLELPSSAGATRAVRPFAQVGIGAVRHVISASVLETRATNFAFNAGLGAQVDIFDGLGLRLMATDYIGRFDVEEATSFEVDNPTTHNWGFVGGLSIAF